MIWCLTENSTSAGWWGQARRQDLAARGAKNQKGATFLNYCIGCMQQPGGQTLNGGTTGPLAGDGPGWGQLRMSQIKVSTLSKNDRRTMNYAVLKLTVVRLTYNVLFH